MNAMQPEGNSRCTSAQSVRAKHAKEMGKLILACEMSTKKIKIHFSDGQGLLALAAGGYSLFEPRDPIYNPFCDDFGPMSFATISNFIRDLDQQIAQCKSDDMVYCPGSDRRNFTNAAFLLGSYMVLKLSMRPSDVLKRFEGLEFEPYRDATFSPPDFGLELIDCWSGIRRAMDHAWIAMPTEEEPSQWGSIDLDEYSQYDDPLNGDLHEVLPGKLVAFSGPKDLDGKLYRDDKELGHREFSPAYYIDIFRELGVSTVVRLNEVHYNARGFTDAGIEHHDLYFDDCTATPREVVARFLRIVDEAPRAVAVHCRAGLGRTGTLIALYLMRKRDFSAREAMGWLRVMRPGSVIGEQQHYLCEVERRYAAVPPSRKKDRSRIPGPPATSHVTQQAFSRKLLADRGSRISRPLRALHPPSPVVLAAQVAAAMKVHSRSSPGRSARVARHSACDSRGGARSGETGPEEKSAIQMAGSAAIRKGAVCCQNLTLPVMGVETRK